MVPMPLAAWIRRAQVTTGGQHHQEGSAERRLFGFVVLTYEFHREGRSWVGRCVELGTATDGGSLEKVEEELDELVGLHLNALEAVGERDRFFAEHGIRLYRPDPPKHVERTLAIGAERKLRDFRMIRVSVPNEYREKKPAGVSSGDG
jgi:hypothetical protein